MTCTPTEDILSTHDLTRRSTEHGEMVDKIYNFQLTTSQGGRLSFRSFRPIQHPFNSRPHKEVDGYSVSPLLCIVIFQLTTSQGGRRIHTGL